MMIQLPLSLFRLKLRIHPFSVTCMNRQSLYSRFSEARRFQEAVKVEGKALARMLTRQA